MAKSKPKRKKTYSKSNKYRPPDQDALVYDDTPKHWTKVLHDYIQQKAGL